MGFVVTSLEQGLIFSLLAIGVFISYKILDIADLTVEGSFVLGGFVFARFITLGLDPISSTLLAFAAGSLAGLLTAILFTKLRIQPLLAGILTMTILHTVSLRVNSKANVSLFKYDTIFDIMNFIPKVLALVIIVIIVKILIDMFFKTEVGYLLVATGDNERLVKSIGEKSDKYKIIGMMLSNALVAASGALFSQNLGLVDITLSDSIIVTALASVIIGDAILKGSSKLKGTTRAIIGTIVYREISGFAISLGLEPTDLRAISAIIVIIFLTYNNFSISEFKKRSNK